MNDKIADPVERIGSAAPITKASPSYIWYIVGVLTVVNMVNTADRAVFAVLAPQIQRDIALTDSQLGLLVGLGFSLFYAICGIPVARLADRRNRRSLIAAAVAIWSLMTALTGAAATIWHLFVARGAVGAAEAGSIPASQSMVCDYVELKKRSGVFAILSVGTTAGLTLGTIAAGALADLIGWRWVFVAVGLPGVALALLVRMTVREPERTGPPLAAGAANGSTLLDTVRAMWASRTYRMLALVVVTYGSTINGLNAWWPSFYVRVFDLSMSAVGVNLGVALGVGPAVGLLLGGLLGNRLAQRDIGLPLLLGAGATLAALPVFLGVLFTASAAASLLLLALGGVLCTLSYGALISSMVSAVPSGVRATAQAIVTFLASLIGLGLTPLVVGVTSDALLSDIGDQSLRFAMLGPICLIPIMTIGFFAASRVAPRELAAST
jgi:predicted MFS family arabinose efflux permease